MTPSNDTRASGVGEGLLALAERCEKASGTDVSLNLAIAIAVAAVDPRTTFTPRGGFGYVSRNQWGVSQVLAYSTSLDAAMTLVPEGVGGEAMNASAGRLNEGNGVVRGLASVSDSLCGPCFTGLAATPALALCAAALRARAQEQHP